MNAATNIRDLPRLGVKRGQVEFMLLNRNFIICSRMCRESKLSPSGFDMTSRKLLIPWVIWLTELKKIDDNKWEIGGTTRSFGRQTLKDITW